MKELLFRIRAINNIWILLFIMLIAILMRIGAYYQLSQSESMKSTIEWVDDWDYVNYSRAIFNGIFLHTEINHEESEFYRIDDIPPLYPIILAGFYNVVGYSNLRFIVILNIILNLLIIYLIYIISRCLIKGKLALLPPFLWSIYINSLILTGRALKEPFITLFILLIVYFIYRFWKKQQIRDLVLLAILNTGFAHLDERYLFMTALSFVFIVYILIRKHNKHLLLRATLLYLVLCALLFTPWMIRNLQRYDKIVFITPRTAIVTDRFFGYKNTEKVIVDLTAKVSPEQLDSIYLGLNPASVDTVTIKNIRLGKMHGITPHYYSLGERMFYNTIGFWQVFSVKSFFTGSGYKYNHYWGLKWNVLILFEFTIFLILALPAFYYGFKKKNIILMLCFYILLINTLQHAILGAGLDRYRAVMDPLVFVSAAYTIRQIQKRLILRAE